MVARLKPLTNETCKDCAGVCQTNACAVHKRCRACFASLCLAITTAPRLTITCSPAQRAHAKHSSAHDKHERQFFRWLLTFEE